MKVFLTCGLLLLTGGCLQNSPPADMAPLQGPALFLLENTDIDEASGLVVSRRDPQRLWLHNDSGGAAALFSVDVRGRGMQRLALDGIRNIDWEDLAIFDTAHGPRLLVADVGDNNAVRPAVQLHLLDEPVDTETAVTVQTLTITYADGPRDVEAVAVDSAEQQAYLLSKRDTPPRLYRVSVDLTTPAPTRMAAFLGTVDTIPPPTDADLEADPTFGRFRSQPTALSVSADGRRIVVTTYKDSYLYPRLPPEPWRDALARPPTVIDTPQFRQTEAGGVSADGLRLFVVSEQLPAPLASIELPPYSAESASGKR